MAKLPPPPRKATPWTPPRTGVNRDVGLLDKKPSRVISQPQPQKRTATDILIAKRNKERGEYRDVGLLDLRDPNIGKYVHTTTGKGGRDQIPHKSGDKYAGLGESGGGYGYGGGQAVTPPEITWSDKFTLEGAPSWWKGMMPSEVNAMTEYAVLMNTMIPYLSPEDQRAVASNLARLFPKAFGGYSPETTSFPTPPTEIDQGTSFKFQSAGRAENMLKALNKMREASGKKEEEFGQGYSFLRHVAKTLQDFGATEGNMGQTRRQIMDMYGALDPLLAETKGEALGAYGEISRAMTQPFFSAGRLIPVTRTQDGKYIFGSENKRWF